MVRAKDAVNGFELMTHTWTYKPQLTKCAQAFMRSALVITCVRGGSS